MQDPHVTPGPEHHRDRSTRLALFGVLAMLAGAGCAMLGLLQLVLLILGGLPGAGSIPIDTRSGLMGAGLYALLGAAFVAVGAGSMRKRRWARTMMLTLAWSWLLGGIAALFLLPHLLDVALRTGSPGMPSVDTTVATAARIVVLGGTSIFGVIVPAVFVWVYRDRHLRRTCELADSRPDWSERCPPPVLGLAVGLAACGVVGALGALRPAVPMFGVLATGPAGVAATLLGSALCLWLGRELYRLRMRGWWGTTIFLVIIGASTCWTLPRIDVAELYAALGYSEQTGDGTAGGFGEVTAWVAGVVTLLTVVYMARIHKHFVRRGAAPG